MLTHKSKKSINLKSKSKNIAKNRSKKSKSLKKKGCWGSCSSSSSSSSSCWSSSSCSYSSSSCSNSCWSGCSSNSYKSCSVSSHGCSSSSSDGSCDNEKHKTLVLGNKYLNIGNDTLTLRFDPSKCNNLSAPIYQMGFGLSNITNGTSTNNVLLLGLNQTTSPYVNVTPRTSGGTYIAPYVSIDFPSVSSTSNVVDDNSNSTISNKQVRFVGNDPWITTSDTFNLTTTISPLGLYTVGKYANISNTIIFGGENINYSNSVYSVTNDTITADFRNLVLNYYNNSDSQITLNDPNVGISMLGHGDVRYLNLINYAVAPNNITFTLAPLSAGPSYIFGNYEFSTDTISVNASSRHVKLTVTYVSSLSKYYVSVN